jgi:hypothetical protein
MSEEDELLALLEAEEKQRKPVVYAKEYTFLVDVEEQAELSKDNGKQWTIMEGIIAKRGGYDLDFYEDRIMFALTIENEYLLDEITHGINEQLAEITGKRIKETELWGAF